MKSLMQELAFALQERGERLRRRKVARIPVVAGRRAWIEFPLIFVERARRPLRPGADLAHEETLYFHQATACLIQDLDVHLEFPRSEHHHTGMGESADRRRGVKANAFDLNWHDDLEFLGPQFTT